MPLTNAFSIDESMVPCYGRHGCTQFIKGKPIRFGFKIWACATVSGYCIQLEPYPGVEEKSGTISAAVEMLSSSLVRSFVKIFQKHLSLFMDKYFTLLSLLEGLKNDLRLIATGTFPKSRIFNSPVEESALSIRGNSQFSDERWIEADGLAG